MSFVATVPAFIMSHVYVGGSIVFLGRWDADSLLHAIERECATYTYVPSPRLVEFADAAERSPERWRSLESILHSASKARPDQLRRLHEVVGDLLVEGWGMAENSGGLVTATTAADFRGESEATGDIFASVGRPVVDTAVEVVGDDDRPLPHDGSAPGELIVRSSALFSGYWRNEEATRSALRGGWYHSGDLGSIDPAGYVYVSDRRTDLIVSGGMNVYPSEVETVIAELPGVAECAVVGAPDERWGQTVVAVVAPATGAHVDTQSVIDHCRERIASYKKPTRVVFVDALPRNTANKVLRRQLSEEVAARA
jgi:acyl-CoA synthetase (AMP-forming)/AMP-acid ligase II